MPTPLYIIRWHWETGTFTGIILHITNTQHYLTWLQIVDSLSELEALMDRMKRLREEREDEEASQEEMTTRFEKEKKESLFVVSGDTFHSFPHSGELVPRTLPYTLSLPLNCCIPDRPCSVFAIRICKSDSTTMFLLCPPPPASPDAVATPPPRWCIYEYPPGPVEGDFQPYSPHSSGIKCDSKPEQLPIKLDRDT